MALIRSREALVSARTLLVNHVRGTVKSFGVSLPRGPARSFHNKVLMEVRRERCNKYCN
jgi:transposase